MKAIIIKLACKPDSKGESEVPGWEVPDTQGLLGIDMRREAYMEDLCDAEWWITHIPSGRRIGYGIYTEASQRLEAVNVAKRFYDLYTARGWDLSFTDPAKVTDPFKALSKDELTAFWAAVAGWTQDKEPTSNTSSEERS